MAGKERRTERKRGKERKEMEERGKKGRKERRETRKRGGEKMRNELGRENRGGQIETKKDKR